MALVSGVVSVVTAQATRQVPGPGFPSPAPRVLSGSDVGFRVEGVDSKGQPFGTLVIRVNGEWVDVRLGTTKATPALSH
jgi:hypothetical protein